MFVSLKKVWKKLGPGLITGSSDDDPSGIATYSQAGAQFGLTTLWTALFTFPLMASIQEMCARIGIVTSMGLTGTIKKHYSKKILYLLLIFSTPAIIFNIGADIAGMGAVGNMLFPKIDAAFFSIFFTIILIMGIVYFPYKKIASILKYLCIVLMVYLIVPFLYKQDLGYILKSAVMPNIHFNKEFISILVGLLGTTISPYLFFWQANMEAEEMKQQKKIIIDKKLMSEMKYDIDFGMFFSNVVMFFIILTTGTVLFSSNFHQIETVEDAAKALEPLAGKAASLLFSIGIIGTGFLAIPVLSGSLSYMYCETFGWKDGLDKKFYEAKAFYFIIVISLIMGLAVNYIGFSPMTTLLNAAILYGLTAPVIIGIILHICNNKSVMGMFINSVKSNILGFITLIVMAIASILLLYFVFISD
jgi:NRAMP (natural resistance-associated macrophage protein)-like metal ion transporter